MKRFFDVLFSCALLVLFFIPVLFIIIAVKILSKGAVFYVSDRVGINNSIFRMYKFRTMRADTPQVATHLMGDSEHYLTFMGRFLRKTSFDELPQLLNILKGDMSFVGPRPALFNQNDLIALRTKKGINVLVPGLTGWAQINGRDELPIPEKVEFDEFYLQNRSFLLDSKILCITLLKVMQREGIEH